MDDDERQPGVTQIPLIQDLVFDPTLPLKSPVKQVKSAKKKRQYPPGYDPDTADLFGDIVEPVGEGAVTEEIAEDVPLSDETVMAEDIGTPRAPMEEKLREELSTELGSILNHLQDQPEP